MDVVRELYSKDHHVHNDRQQQVMKNLKQHSAVEYLKQMIYYQFATNHVFDFASISP